MSGYASRADVLDVVQQTIRTDHNGLGLPRDPARFNLSRIVRDCFYSRGAGYGWGMTDADFCQSLRDNYRPAHRGKAAAVSTCRTCGEDIERALDRSGQRGTAWATAAWGDDRDFQCFSDNGRHAPAVQS